MSEPTGTANILHQFTAYTALCEDYSSVVANELTKKNLSRHGVDVTTGDVAAWHRLNTAAARSKMDINGERERADAGAKEAVSVILGAAAASTVNAQAMPDASEDDFDCEEVFELEHEDEDELSSASDIYGYDDQEQLIVNKSVDTSDQMGIECAH